MSTFWSTWIIVLAVLTFGISFLLLCWAPWVKIPTQPDGTTTHIWAHGVLREGVRDLPRWWVIVSGLGLDAVRIRLFGGADRSAGRGPGARRRDDDRFWPGEAPAMLATGLGAPHLVRFTGRPRARRTAGVLLLACAGLTFAAPWLPLPGLPMHHVH